MDIFSNGYIYPQEIVAGLIIFIIIAWLALRSTKRAELRYLRDHQQQQAAPIVPDAPAVAPPVASDQDTAAASNADDVEPAHKTAATQRRG